MTRLTTPVPSVMSDRGPREIDIDGVGRVMVSREFFSLSPEQQNQAVQEITSYHTQNAPQQATPAQPPQPEAPPERGVVDQALDNLPLGIGAEGLSPTRAFADSVVGAVRGVGEVFDNGAELVQGAYNQTAGRVFGQSDSATQADQSGGGFSGATAPLGEGNPISREGGRIAGAALLTGGVGGPLVQGASAGALLSEAETPGQFAGDVATGAVGGKLAGIAANTLGTWVAPQVSAATRRLHALGVRMTPGQVAPGFRRTEERLTSRPFLGGQIVRGRQQSYRDFNRVAIEEPIAPYNQFAQQSGRPPITIPPNAEGQEMIRHVGDELSSRYEAVIPRLRFNSDPQLATDMAALRSTINNGDMTPAALDRFEGIVRNQVMSRLPAGTQISGPAFRQIEKDISRQIRRFSRSDRPDDQATAGAFEDLQDLMQAALRRSNPDAAAELSALHGGWARLVRVEGAAEGAVNGLFSPRQFRESVRRNDNSTRHRAMARGEALQQQLADDATDILPSQYPDSGTAGRSQLGMLDPRYYIGALQGLAYGPGTQQTITNALMAPRHPFANTIADMLRGLPAPQAGAAAGVSGGNALLGF